MNKNDEKYEKKLKNVSISLFLFMKNFALI
jgi:hypothetical protein